MRARSYHRIVRLRLLLSFVFLFRLWRLDLVYLRLWLTTRPWLANGTPASNWQTPTSCYLPPRHPPSPDRNNFYLGPRLRKGFSFILGLILQHLLLVGQYEVAHLR